jgi:hypothetical protein
MDRVKRPLLSTRGLTRALGWISLVMGLSLLSPTRAARLLGLGNRPRLMCAIGLRDIVIGTGLLRYRRPAFWLRMQALADAIDAAIVGKGLLTGTVDRVQGWSWLAFALGSGWAGIRRAHHLGTSAGE